MDDMEPKSPWVIAFTLISLGGWAVGFVMGWLTGR